MLMSEQPDDPEIRRISILAGELRVLVGRLKRRLQEQMHFGDLTLSQVLVLGRLERDGPATVTTLARAEGMRPQSMGANVSVLEAAGLVSATPDPNDRRQTILSVTPACLDRIKADRAARQDWLARAIQTNFAADEQQDLMKAVGLLNRLVEA